MAFASTAAQLLGYVAPAFIEPLNEMNDDDRTDG
eukprot:COSAG02_NODE_55507_length_290_cov_0.801047_1_plen_33_part_10